MARKSVMEALAAKTYKASPPNVAAASGSSVSPPQKNRRLEGNAQVPSPCIQVFEVQEVKGTENVNSSSVQALTVDLSEGTCSEDKPVDLFIPQPYIPQENRLFTVEDFAMSNGNVGFALATSITLPKDDKKLKAIRILELEVKSLQRVAEVKLVHALQMLTQRNADSKSLLSMLKSPSQCLSSLVKMIHQVKLTPWVHTIFALSKRIPVNLILGFTLLPPEDLHQL
ncbi:hypothetical protein LguiB_005501 [Lonicera macranthoides]